MSGELVPIQPGALAMAGQAANQAAAKGVFSDYQSRKASNTLRRQRADLEAFSAYLQAAGLAPGSFAEDPEAWRGVTWGIVAGFMRWLLAEGFTVSTANVRLSTVKVYAALAAQAGALDPQELALIRSVKGYKRAEGLHLDEQREAAGTPTRRARRSNGSRAGKKAQAVSLTRKQAGALKAQPDTPRGRRDALLMCLLLDHGLRVGEAAGLAVSDFDLKAGELCFYREKVDRTQVHRLTPDTLRAAQSYLASDGPALGSIWRASASKGSGREAYRAGALTGQGMSARALTGRVLALGRVVGIVGLSAHDCRHYWATQAARNGTPLDRLQDAGGWSSLAMPARYIEAAKIANEGVKLE